MDMRFWWLIYRIKQQQFTVHWKPGAENLADYFSKHHSPAHHSTMRPILFHTQNEKPVTYSEVLRGCNNTTPTRAYVVYVVIQDSHC